MAAEGENDFVESGSQGEDWDERELDSGELGKSSSFPTQWCIGYLIHHFPQSFHSRSD